MFMRVRADRRSGLLPEVAGRNCGSTRQVVLLVTAVGDCKVVSLSRDGKSNSELGEVRKRYLWGSAFRSEGCFSDLSKCAMRRGD